MRRGTKNRINQNQKVHIIQVEKDLTKFVKLTIKFIEFWGIKSYEDIIIINNNYIFCYVSNSCGLNRSRPNHCTRYTCNYHFVSKCVKSKVLWHDKIFQIFCHIVLPHNESCWKLYWFEFAVIFKMFNLQIKFILLIFPCTVLNFKYLIQIHI